MRTSGGDVRGIEYRPPIAMEDNLDGLRQYGSRVGANPSDLTALEELRVIVGEADIDPGLAPAIENLVDRLLDGTIAPDAKISTLVAEACMAASDASPASLDDLIERLDLAASGMADVLLDAPGGSRVAPTVNEPPLLTVRHDGTLVTPGSFDLDAVVETARSAPAAISVTHFVDALASAVERLRSQVGALDLLAGAELEHLVGELAETAAEMERLQDGLRRWADESAALLAGRDE